MVSVKAAFNINVSHSKCKRANRMILEKMEGSFADDYNKLEAYVNELRYSNPGTDVVINISKDALDSDFDSLEGLHTQKERKISDKLADYKELHKSMTFKDIPEARKFINMYSLANGYGLKQLKSCPQKLMYICLDKKCPFVCHISKDSKGPGVKFKTLREEHKCNIAYDNHIVDRANRMILEKMEGSFADDYNKLEAYANELRYSNPGTDVGLIDSVKLVLLEAYHRYCYLWWAAWSTYEEDFKDKLRNIGQLDEDGKDAVEDLMRYPPQSWRRAYFDTVCKNYSVDNNLIESFNSWIKEARFKQIIKILEDIRVKVMNMLREHEYVVMTWSNDFNPKPCNCISNT
ncbi:uncharacterized protein [Nicotiana tomentosiformis]|uniref:uncharacterized protein n=1 Tax=Nicotiana tomentosiformis TaxID=4098 RepID=UPI00388CA3E4